MRRQLAVAAIVSLFAVSVRAELASPKNVTFNKDVAPIVFKSCTSCHRDGEVAPFALVTYEDVAKRAKQIASVTHSRYMPPWKAEPGFGEFLDDRRLSDAEIQTFQAWVDAGKPEGSASDLPKVPEFPSGWQLGTPDLVLKMPEPFKVPAEGRDVYRNFVIPSGVDEDKYVTAVEYRPSNRRVVHHAIFFLDTSGAARKKDAQDPLPGFSSFGGPGFIPSGSLGGWAPGAFPRFLPDGTARLLKKGSDIAIQTHFHPSGKPEEEQSTLGLYFAKKKPEKNIAGIAVANRKIDIPAGEKRHVVHASFTTPVEATVIGLTPHAHLICKEIKAEAIHPDGRSQPIIWIKDWDFNWQDQYQYAKPFKLPKGTRLEVDFIYDNSADNIRNPSNPPKRVTFGEQTTDEMAMLFFTFTTDNQGDAGKLKLAQLGELVRSRAANGGAGVGGGTGAGGKWMERLKEYAKRFDTDGDGEVSEQELSEGLKTLKERK